MNLTWLSEHYRWIFLPLGLGHLALFLTLYSEHQERLANLRVFIRNLARRLVMRWSDERPNSTVDEEIDILLHDLRDALPSTGANWDLEHATRVREAVFAIDQPRDYLYGTLFEKRLNLAKAITETYPLLGIVGTVLAIAAGMASAKEQAPVQPPAIVQMASPSPGASPAAALPAVAPPETGTEDNELRNVTQNFGHSVWTTLIGLSLAIFFMLVNSWVEPEFHRLTEYRIAIRDVLHQIKTRLDAMPGSTTFDPDPRLNRPLRAANEPPR